MIKFVVLFVLVAVVTAAPAPGFIPLGAHLVAHSTSAGNVPTAVSSSSSSVVHGAAVTPTIQNGAAPGVTALAAASPAVATVAAAPAIAAAPAAIATPALVAPALATHPAHSALTAHGLINGAALGLNGIHGVHAALF